MLPLTGLAGKHDERAAARQKDGKRGQVGVYVVLVDAGLIEPHERLLNTVCGAQLLGPITPHLCEHIWSNLLKREGCVVRTPLPKIPMTAEHFNLVMAGRYLQENISTLRKLVAKMEAPKKAKKGEAPPPPAKVSPEW